MKYNNLQATKYKMKKASLIMIALLPALSACRNDADLFKGDYSYKTSGTVYITDGSTQQTYQLSNEIGQLRIVGLSSADSVLIIKSALSGSVETMRAKVTNDSIFIAPYQKSLSIVMTNSVDGDYDITVDGCGVMYDDNTIILTQNYYNDQTNQIQISGENIITFAQRNE